MTRVETPHGGFHQWVFIYEHLSYMKVETFYCTWKKQPLLLISINFTGAKKKIVFSMFSR